MKTFFIFATVLVGMSMVLYTNSLVFAVVDTKTSDNHINTSPWDQPTLTPKEKLKIAFLTDGLFSDAGWGAFGYNAAQEIQEEYSYAVDVKENIPISKIEETLRDYAKAGYDLIISQGFEWGNPAIKVGKDYPNTKFVIFTGLVNSSNVASIYPMQQEGTYLLGALAASMSKTGVIGFIGGEPYPNLINIYEGYKQGAHDINPKVKVLMTFVYDWDNITKGKKAAMSQIQQGADFLLQVADTAGQGVIEAAKEKGIYVFGAISDQNKLAPNTVLTSFVLDTEKVYDQVIKSVQNGNFSGEIYKPGLESEREGPGDGIVYLAPYYNLEDKVPEKVKEKLQRLNQDIINGKITIPEKYSSYSIYDHPKKNNDTDNKKTDELF
ncbi:MAG TPA: BMP family protein [Candidatus Nitrosocosmicus sp.]|nr:BMP family protein [Candidatus Nitrosocosmicus sp.]